MISNHIARWDDAEWDALGKGLDHSLSAPWMDAVLIDGTDVYVGGLFNHAAGRPIATSPVGTARHGTPWETGSTKE